MFTGVYCRGSRAEKELLWSELEECITKWDGNWIIGGDFNMTMSREDRSDNNFSAMEANKFKERMDRVGVVDPEGSGPGPTKNVVRELIRFFASANLMVDLAGISHKTLSRPTSDHFPICIEAEGIKWGRTPFRLDNKWLGKENFGSFVEIIWKTTKIEDCASYRVAQKLRILKNEIKVWSKEVMEKDKAEFDRFMAEISNLDRKESILIDQ